MTLQAVIPRCGQVLEDANVSNLPRVRNARNDVVTFVAAYALPRCMVAMTEDRREPVRGLRRAIVRAEGVTCSTRADLCLRRMTREAVVVRSDPHGNGLSRSRWLVTVRAACGRTSIARLVSRVIELHIEALDEFRGERFHRWRCRVHLVVADRAHRGFFTRVRELTQVTTDAGIVARVLEFLVFGLPAVTGHTVELFVLRDLVVELAEGRIRRLNDRRLRCLGGGERGRRPRLLFETTCGEDYQSREKERGLCNVLPARLLHRQGVL